MNLKEHGQMHQNADIMALAKVFGTYKNIVFFGGAGTSTESHIPDFRSKDGLYSTPFEGYEPEYLLSNECLMRQPKLFYDYLRAKLNFPDAQPNKTHKVLAKLEEMGILNAIVTQNIDGLHQAAGSRHVFELHGTLKKARCTNCDLAYDGSILYGAYDDFPTCPTCHALIRPEVTLYGEMLDQEVVESAIQAISDASVLIVGGTSLAVYPAAGFLEYFHGNQLILINRDTTPIDHKAHIVIRESIGQAFEEAFNIAFGPK